MRELAKALWTEREFMASIGYTLVKDDGEYAHYTNIAGTRSPGYGIMGAEKRHIYFNRGYSPADGIFVGIREDGDTRNVFNGVIDTEITFKLILNAVR